MPLYEHRQVGRALIVLGLVQAAVGIALFSLDRYVAAAILVVAVLTPWLFATLTVTVTDELVRFRFGPGLVGRTVAVNEIRAVRVVTLPWYSGIGIHWTANGILYNVAFGPVVQLELSSGTRVNVGSDEPEVVAAAVRDALGHRHTDAPLVPPTHGMPWPLVSAVLLAAVGLLVAVMVVWNGERPIEASLTANTFVAKGAGYTTAMPIGDIASVAMDDSLPPITQRTNGFAAGGKLRGHFVLGGVGPADLYVDRNVPPFVTVQSSRGALVVVNAATPDATRALFAELQRAIKR
jgi:hypothetical protein